MAVIPVDYAQANFKFTGASLPYGAEITLGLNIELIPGTLNDLAVSIASDFGIQIMAQVDSGVSNTSVLVKAGPNDTGPSVEVPGAGAGAVMGDTSPPNTAWLVRKVTGFGGRTGRGRLYLPGITDGNVLDDGAIGSTALTNMQTAWDNFYDDLVSYGCPPALLHGPGSPVSSPMLITSFSVDGKVATQRRRLRR